MRTIVFELCAETIQACIAAREGGADRIELCSALDLGGLTPSHGLIHQALELAGLPIHAMVRPRGGNFFYTDAEFAVMERDLLHMRQMGVAGVVLGLLRADRSVDIERTSQLVRAAAPLEVTFHRAFDMVDNPEQGLEDVIATGCDRVLTSGGAADIDAGSPSLARLLVQAAGRIHVAAGGGLRLHNAATVVRATSGSHFHGSLRTSAAVGAVGGANHVESDQVRAVIRALSDA